MYRVKLGVSYTQTANYKTVTITNFKGVCHLIFKQTENWLVLDLTHMPPFEVTNILKQLVEREEHDVLDLSEINVYPQPVFCVSAEEYRASHYYVPILDEINVTSISFDTTEELWGYKEEQLAKITFHFSYNNNRTRSTIKCMLESYLNGLLLPTPVDMIHHYLSDKIIAERPYEEFLMNCGYADTTYARKTYRSILKETEKLDRLFRKDISVLNTMFMDY